MTSYELSRNYFDWCFENPEKISPNHTAIYFFAIEHCNRLGWRDKFGFPTQMAMDAIGIKKNQTYTRYLNELVDFGFIKMVQKSTNQYSANIISLISAKPKNGKALDEAIVKHGAKQTESMGQSNSTIDKPITNNNITNNTIDLYFDKFWNIYDKKIDTKKCKDKFEKLTENEMILILGVVQKYVDSTPDKQYRKNPMTWLNGKCWNDSIVISLENKPSGEDEYMNNVMKQFNANKLL